MFRQMKNVFLSLIGFVTCLITAVPAFAGDESGSTVTMMTILLIGSAVLIALVVILSIASKKKKR